MSVTKHSAQPFLKHCLSILSLLLLTTLTNQVHACTDDIAKRYERQETFNQPLKDLDVQCVTNMSRLFSYAKQFNQPIENWNTQNLINATHMFYQAQSFNQPLNQWNTKALLSTYGMFRGAVKFNQPLDQWNLPVIANMARMFEGASAFNSPLPKQITIIPRLVIDTNRMFKDAVSFNQDFEWRISGPNIDQMFEGATAFNSKPPIIEQAHSLKGFFKNASSFNQPLTWTTYYLNDISELFEGASQFNQDISDWKFLKNVGTSYKFHQDMYEWSRFKSLKMNRVFKNAIRFNQPIGSWDTSSAIEMEEMFMGATAFNQDLSQWCVSQFKEKPKDFDTNTPAWEEKNKPVWGTCPRGEDKWRD